MIIIHSGQRIDCSREPIPGAKLALNASWGCASKYRAWSWAETAIEALRLKSVENSQALEAILKDSSNNYPNCEAGLEFLNTLD